MLRNVRGRLTPIAVKNFNRERRRPGTLRNAEKKLMSRLVPETGGFRMTSSRRYETIFLMEARRT
jgi:hypothetical protein